MPEKRRETKKKYIWKRYYGVRGYHHPVFRWNSSVTSFVNVVGKLIVAQAEEVQFYFQSRGSGDNPCVLKKRTEKVKIFSISLYVN